MQPNLDLRAARHAALGDITRLAIVDELCTSDRTPSELGRRLGLESNLLAHHLDVLESVGMINRARSSGDGRRRYVHLLGAALPTGAPARHAPGRALFVCTRNSARSQLAAVLWQSLTGGRGDSAGTHPAAEVDLGAIAAAKRAGLDLSHARPRTLSQAGTLPKLVVTVCDRAHEEVATDDWLHWSIPDPVGSKGRAVYDRVVDELRARITALTGQGAAS